MKRQNQDTPLCSRSSLSEHTYREREKQREVKSQSAARLRRGVKRVGVNSLCQQPVFAALRLPKRIVLRELVQAPADKAAAEEGEGEESNTERGVLSQTHLVVYTRANRYNDTS